MDLRNATRYTEECSALSRVERLPELVLGTLLLENDFGLLCGRLIFAVGTGDIAKRSRLRNRTEFPQGPFSLRVRVRVREAPDKWRLGRHGVRLGMLNVVGEYRRHGLARYGTLSLSKSRCRGKQ